MDKKLLAFLGVAFSYIVWSLMGLVLNKSAFTPFQNEFLASATVVICLLLIPNFRKKLQISKKMLFTKQALLLGISAGIAGALWLNALTLLPIGQAVFLYNSLPLFAFIFEILLLKESLDIKRFGILLTGIVGLGIILSSDLSTNHQFFSLGSLAVLTAAFFQALAGISNKKLSKTHSIETILLIITFFQTIVVAPIALMQPWHFTLLSFLGAIGFLGIIATLFAFYTYISAFTRLKTSSIMLVGYIEPLFASLWGFLFLFQQLPLTVFLGGAITLFAGYFMVKLEQKTS
ncbi:MAG TPA: DMT family transporter [Candidatus Saccharimonadales bacterium]|nr:DMT family transporter [Candidatus Saccharimonadales bacterium]